MGRASLLIWCAWHIAEAWKTRYCGLSFKMCALTVCVPCLMQMMVVSQVLNLSTQAYNVMSHMLFSSTLQYITSFMSFHEAYALWALTSNNPQPSSRKFTLAMLAGHIKLTSRESAPTPEGACVGRQYMAGGDLCTALQRDMMQSERGGKRRLGWYGRGCDILVGVARGLAYLHEQRVRAG